MSEAEEDYDSTPMTKKAIVDTCLKHGLYVVPDLNDVLYLHYKGFSKICELDEYINVKTLWLNNNAISTISGLSTLVNLSTLYLQDNLIENIEGVDELVSLETLILSHNYIESVSGLDKCVKLNTIELDHNHIRSVQQLNGLLECPSLEVVNISHNKINDKADDIIAFFEQLKNLKVLRMEGNPFIRMMQNYRRRIINALPELVFLDDAPVSQNDRRLAAAWKIGGKEAEIQERYKINDEKESDRKENMRDFRRMKRDAVLSSGKNIEDYPELLSSDDEQKPRLLKEKFKRISHEVNDNNKDDPNKNNNDNDNDDDDNGKSEMKNDHVKSTVIKADDDETFFTQANYVKSSENNNNERDNDDID
ncbi:hypothetical protein TRFO_14698 [Tritrichomonas foetus]|uniref:Leucine Rich Repeat family protein n=1 Tax=Tritrichomonas foetus TaxID=1144522 RepID=A0A1J4KUF6_9EUKA|nr:hypothetical protein TRFO_14698 [Tritrichomonas foetus]|eukprot:OHT14903.1 hypothetical protein TRFO_14698 [Tritrichomonas foetus]